MALAASAPQKRIGFLCLNLKSSKLQQYVGVNEPTGSLEDVKPELRARALTPGKLLRACTVYPVADKRTLHVLFGCSKPEQAEFYAPEEIQHLLDRCREAFDVAIIDVHAYWDNAATITAVREADAGYVVANRRLHSFQVDLKRWFGLCGPVFGIELGERFQLIVSGCGGDSGVSDRAVQSVAGFPLIGNWRLDDALADAGDRGALMELYRSELSAGNPRLRGVVERLLAVAGVPKQPAQDSLRRSLLQRVYRSGEAQA